MGMTLDELYQRMSGQEIDERLAAALLDSPEYRQKLQKEAEVEKFNNLSPEEQAELLTRLFKGGK